MPLIIDAETILSISEEWMKLEEDWKPIDLETEDDFPPSKLTPVFSSLDLRKTTFDSSILLQKLRKKINRKCSKASDVIDYNQFLQDLEQEAIEEVPRKQFYFINGQIISAFSVDEICENIDDIFKSVEKLSSATSTIRLKKKMPEHVSCSISTGGLSFDDTEMTKRSEDDEAEKSDRDDIDKFIDEAFQQLSVTVASMAYSEDADDEISKSSVTTLVKKFSSILKSPAIGKSPRRKRQCCDRFKQLAEFWSSKACDKSG